jgi:hypothetical protein
VETRSGERGPEGSLNDPVMLPFNFSIIIILLMRAE